MDYKPRFSQPFTLYEAIGLDVAVITEGIAVVFNKCRISINCRSLEIARLQNSLERLRETQEVLQAVIIEPGESDPEIMLAFEENQVVMCAILKSLFHASAYWISISTVALRRSVLACWRWHCWRKELCLILTTALMNPIQQIHLRNYRPPPRLPLWTSATRPTQTTMAFTYKSSHSWDYCSAVLWGLSCSMMSGLQESKTYSRPTHILWNSIVIS